MKSIQGRLSIWFLGSFALLWALAATGVYLAVQRSLIASLEAELAVDARGVRFAAKGFDAGLGNDPGAPAIPGNRRLRSILPEFDSAEGGKYYQIWDETGEIVSRSPSLGSRLFDHPGPKAKTSATFHNLTLEDAGEVRALLLFTPPGKREKGPGPKGKGKGQARQDRAANPGIITLIAKETASIEETLRSLAGGLALFGFILLGGAVLLVRLGIRRSLAPLNRLASETTQVDASSLHERFHDDDAPRELEPVYSHLNDLIARLESSFEHERRFNADLAHEMRTPVAELRMINEVALQWEDQSGEVTHRNSLEIATQLESIIESLLTLARCESGEVSTIEEALCLTTVVEETCARHAEAAAARSIDFELQSNGTEPTISADPSLFQHILTNLISNAVAYAPESSTVAISLANDRLAVTNSAPRLSDEDLPDLFRRYWRKDPARSGSTHTGLGLSLAQTCAQLCGLTIEPTLEDGVLTMQVGPDRDPEKSNL
ncbi:MAG: ATP-binding protein [Verrucomicrobiota bacterium]